ncbi:hypothetical protein DdX_13682 [Ditylenchus destructor]|uniref:Uncharacterized protein n=1 Tax=Ditylenchus destructor TaxID=166010 RepID=A0AAD4R2M9_9BILA|nr:hypothetical protein DdX_13682 [Ditylenchus destructor]
MKHEPKSPTPRVKTVGICYVKTKKEPRSQSKSAKRKSKSPRLGKKSPKNSGRMPWHKSAVPTHRNCNMSDANENKSANHTSKGPSTSQFFEKATYSTETYANAPRPLTELTYDTKATEFNRQFKSAAHLATTDQSTPRATGEKAHPREPIVLRPKVVVPDILASYGYQNGRNLFPQKQVPVSTKNASLLNNYAEQVAEQLALQFKCKVDDKNQMSARKGFKKIKASAQERGYQPQGKCKSSNEMQENVQPSSTGQNPIFTEHNVNTKKNKVPNSKMVADNTPASLRKHIATEDYALRRLYYDQGVKETLSRIISLTNHGMSLCDAVEFLKPADMADDFHCAEVENYTPESSKTVRNTKKKKKTTAASHFQRLKRWKERSVKKISALV